MVYSAKSGHPGGSLSIADVITALYFKEMNIDPENFESDGNCMIAGVPGKIKRTGARCCHRICTFIQA